MTAVTLSQEQLQELAVRIADELRDVQTLGRAATGATYGGELIDASELARRIGRTRAFVYGNSQRLGAIRLGDGDRPRLAFRWPDCLDTLSGGMGSPIPNVPVAKGVAPVRRRRRSGTTAALLPVRGVSGGSGR